MCSVLPFALLGGQLSRGLQVFVDQILLDGGQTGLVPAVVHGVLAFTLNTSNTRSHDHTHTYRIRPGACESVFYLRAGAQLCGVSEHVVQRDLKRRV